MGFGRREAAREVEKVEVGARTLKRRLLADDERTAPAPRPAASSGRRVALTRAIGGAAFVYLAHRAWPRVRQDGGRGPSRAQARPRRAKPALRDAAGAAGGAADVAAPPATPPATQATRGGNSSRDEAVEKTSRIAARRDGRERGDASPPASRELPVAVSDSSKSIAALRAPEEDARRPLFDDPSAAGARGSQRHSAGQIARVRRRQGPYISARASSTTPCWTPSRATGGGSLTAGTARASGRWCSWAPG